MNRPRRRLTMPVLCLTAFALTGCSAEPPRATSSPAAATDDRGLHIAFSSETEPPRSGDNTFEVSVRNDGMPVDDAMVTVVFSMPAMPAMNMPEMRSTATLQPSGQGRYRGVGQLSMAGTWNIRVAVTKDGQDLGTRTLSVVAK